MILSPRPPFLREGRGSLLLILGTLLLFADVVFRGQVFFFGDLSLYFLPELHFLRTELLAGRIPLWNPYVNCGQPFVGNPQTWVLYPSTLLLFFFSAERANALSTFVHVLWAGFGMLAFLRIQRLSSVAATLGAVAFAFGGAFVSKAQFPNMFQAMSWLPWLLWATEGVLRRPVSGRCALLALCVGLTLLAAHAQVTLMQLYLLLAWVGFRLYGIAPASRLRTLGALALAAALGLGLALAQLLPVVEHALASTRPQLTLGAANRFYLPWRELVLLVAPNSLGNPAFSVGWSGKGNFWEPCCYLGLIPLVLLGVRGNALPLLKNETKFWSLVALLGFWLALGRYGGLYLVAFYLLPGVKIFHDPARWLYLGTFALAVLAAQGLERVRLKEWGKWGIVLVTLGELIFFSRTLNPTCPARVFTAEGASADSARVFHLRPYKDWKALAPYKRYNQISLAALAKAQTPNLPLRNRVRQVGGYEPVARRDISEVLKALGTLPELADALSTTQVQQLEALGVQRVWGGTGERILANPAPLVSGGRVLREWPGLIEIVPSDPAVVVREAHALGWQVWADGVLLRVESAPPVFMRVLVPPGTKRVLFRYNPLSWRLGVFLSVGAGCILFGLMMHATRTKQWQS